MIKINDTYLVQNIEKIVFCFIWISYVIICLFARGDYWNQLHPGATLTTGLALPITFYANANYTIPHFLRKGRIFQYTLVCFTVYLAFFAVRLFFLWLDGASAEELWQCIGPLHIFSNDLFLSFLLGFILSFAYRLIKDLILNNRLIEKLENEKNQMQLAYLKSQVDPHFLFNTLNSIYATALEENSHRTADGITKLSTLMRYNLHDTQEATIILEKELDYIRKYVDLQTDRATSSTIIDMQINVDAHATQNLNVAPMILIPFIENAFKHGVSPTEDSTVNILVDLVDQNLELSVTNTKTRRNNEVIKSGVGLRNVKERLQLLYPSKHQLRIEEGDAQYSITLNLALS